MPFLKDTKYTSKKATSNCSCYFQNGLSVSTIMISRTPFQNIQNTLLERLFQIFFKKLLLESSFRKQKCLQNNHSENNFAYKKTIPKAFLELIKFDFDWFCYFTILVCMEDEGAWGRMNCRWREGCRQGRRCHPRRDVMARRVKVERMFVKVRI